MFSKRLLTIVCLILFILTNIIFLSISAKHRHPETLVGKLAMAAVAPFQEGVVQTIRFFEHMWGHYFYLVSVKQECDRLQASLDEAKMEMGRYVEAEQTSRRLRRLLEIKAEVPHHVLTAQVVGIDPSGWYKTIIVNRGTSDGVVKGAPVISPDGIVGQIVSSSFQYSKVLLMIDRSHAVDALIQRNRTRGVVEGETDALCRFKYVVRKAELEIGDVVISSGLDRIFPKGLRIGAVESISKTESGIFQKVKVAPFVDFARLEEVLILVKDPDKEKEKAPEHGDAEEGQD